MVNSPTNALSNELKINPQLIRVLNEALETVVQLEPKKEEPGTFYVLCEQRPVFDKKMLGGKLVRGKAQDGLLTYSRIPIRSPEYRIEHYLTWQNSNNSGLSSAVLFIGEALESIPSYLEFPLHPRAPILGHMVWNELWSQGESGCADPADVSLNLDDYLSEASFKFKLFMAALDELPATNDNQVFIRENQAAILRFRQEILATQ